MPRLFSSHRWPAFLLWGILWLGLAQTGLSSNPGDGARRPSSGRTSETAPTSGAARLKPQPSFVRLPLAFERNLGQSDHRVLYQARGAAYTVFLASDGAVLSLNGGGPEVTKRPRARGISEPNTAMRSVVGFRLVGANPSPRVSGEDELQAKSNYFMGSDPSKWTTGIPNYARVSFDEVYPGVGLVYYGTGRQLEEDWVVAPGADPGQIAFEVTGASRISIDAQGDLCLAVPEGQVRLHKPSVYQSQSEARGQRVRTAVEGSFVLAKPNRVSFRIGAYDRTKTLVIDPAVLPPTVTASTYLGGSGFDEARALAIDIAGDLYVAGDTESTDFPVSGAAAYPTCTLDTSGQCARAGFIAKFDPSGATLLFSTYFGGSGSQYALGLALDSAGDAYVTGQTTSADFPTTASAFQPACALGGGVCFDAYLLKLQSDGSALLYSTYLGGTNTDSAYGLAVDSSGDAYVAGETASADFPVTSGAAQSKCGTDGNCNPVNGISQADAFIAKINPALSGTNSLVYSTFLGGSGVDYASAVALDSSLNIYVTGSTNSTDLRTTAGILQPNCRLNGTTCQGEPFVAKINPSVSGSGGLVYMTYLGGSGSGGSQWGQDTANSIAVDSSGDAYVAGQTVSVDFPVTPGAFQTKCGTDGQCNPVDGNPTPDAFVSKLNSTGSALVFSTYLGGSGADFAAALSLDQYGDVYLTGGTYSATSFPAINTLPPGVTTLGGEDVIVAGFNSIGTGMITSFTLGGSGNDVGYGVARDSKDNLYVAGATLSANFPVVNPFQADCGGGLSQCATGDAFVTQLGQMTAPFNSLSVSSLSFGDVPLGTSSRSQAVSVLNSGNQALALTTVALGGTNPGDFSETDTCTNVTLQPNDSCAVNVTFTPTAAGSRAATVTLNSDAVNGNQTASLSGTGTNTTLTVTPSSLTFGSQIKGTTSAAQVIALTNTGSSALTVSSVAISGDFAETNNCGSSVAVGAVCSINVTFTPSAIGTRTGSLTITDSATGSPQSVGLSGSGAAATLTFTPSSLTLPSQLVGTTSTTMTVTVTANGSAAFTSIATTGTNAGDFLVTDTCGSALAALKNCTLSVTFTPSAPGTRTAAVTLTDDANGSPQNVNLTGTGVNSSILVTPGTLNFTGQAVGTTSEPQAVTVTNTGGTALTISSATITGANAGDFAQIKETNSCGTSLAADANCAINVTFSPSAAGSRAATLTLSDNAIPTGTQAVSLTGTGEAPGVLLTPTSLTFPTQVVKTSSAAQAVTLTNTGNEALAIIGINMTGGASGDFSETNKCGSSLAAGVSCTISVVFAPVSGGTLSANLSISDNAAKSPQQATLSGAGGDFTLAVTPASGVTVSAGQEATDTVTLTPVGGFNQTVTVTCANAPQLSTCSLPSNGSVTLNGTSPSSLTMTILTTAPSAAAPDGHTRRRLPPLGLFGSPVLWLAALGLVMLAWRLPKHRTVPSVAIAIFSTMLWASCGGSSSNSVSTPGTPAGTYSLSVSATYAGLSHSSTASLTVH